MATGIIDQGIGPTGTILYFITLGLDIGISTVATAPDHRIYTPPATVRSATAADPGRSYTPPDPIREG